LTKAQAHRLKVSLTWIILASGLSIIFLDKLDATFMSIQISHLARTIFWAAVILYFWLRLYGKISKRF